MKAKGFFTVDDDLRLVASDTDAPAQEIKRKLKSGDRLLISLQRPRNPDHHRMAFAVFNEIAEATGETVEKIYNELKFLLGRFDWIMVKDKNGKERAACVLQSISFESMNQDEFQKFWRDAWVIITERYFPGVPQKNIDHILQIVAPREMENMR
jgi:sulfatase maturation enzyme AslB (radical SAM superfamily)